MIYLIEQHYKHKVSQLKQEEQKIVLSLKLFHPEQIDDAVATANRQDDGNLWSIAAENKYTRHGLRPRNVLAEMSDNYRISEVVEETIANMNRLILAIKQLNKR